LSLSAADAKTISFRLDDAVENPPSNGGSIINVPGEP
jgi:hypothetical protein